VAAAQTSVRSPPGTEPVREAPRDPARDLVRGLLPGIPRDCRPGSRGWCAAVACLLEAAAPKPGNVHPGAAFADLSFADLAAAAVAIAPAVERAADRRLGATILEAVSAARDVTPSNANLGIVLAIAPLAAAAVPRPRDVAGVLAGLGPADAADVWRAIAIARPGGLGRVARWDVADAAPDDLLAAMRLAAPRDAIARLWAEGYEDLVTGPVADLAAELAAGHTLTDAIVRSHLRQLARVPDSLIVRRHGADVAAEVSLRAAATLAAADWRPAAAALDASLRSPRRINPGTTADLVAAALFVLLSEGRLAIDPLPAPAAPR